MFPFRKSEIIFISGRDRHKNAKTANDGNAQNVHHISPLFVY